MNFNEWIAKLATTNYRIFMGVGEAVIYVLATLVLMALRIPIDPVIHGSLGIFILAQMGIDYKTFSKKRTTDADYVAATQSVPVPPKAPEEPALVVVAPAPAPEPGREIKLAGEE